MNLVDMGQMGPLELICSSDLREREAGGYNVHVNMYAG